MQNHLSIWNMIFCRKYLHSITWPFDCNLDCPVYKSIHSSTADQWVIKYSHPFWEIPVWCNDCWSSFIPGADEFIQVILLELILAARETVHFFHRGISNRSGRNGRSFDNSWLKSSLGEAPMPLIIRTSAVSSTHWRRAAWLSRARGTSLPFCFWRSLKIGQKFRFIYLMSFSTPPLCSGWKGRQGSIKKP